MISLLESILGTYDKKKDEYLFFCPFCNKAKRKFSINVDKGAWKCWVCNSSGRSFFSLFKQLNCTKEQVNELRGLLGQTGPIRVDTESTIVNLSLPEEYIPLTRSQTTFEYKNALAYLLKRNIAEGEILRYQLGFCPAGLYAERIIVPSYDESGKLNYFVARSYYDVPLKYKNPPISKNVVGFEMQINFSLPIVLCEGVFDAMAIKTNAIPLLGKVPPRKLLERISMSSCPTIYLALDADALRDSITLSKKLMALGKNINLIQLDGKDPSELGFDHMANLIKNSNPLNFSQLLRLQLS